MSAQFGDKEIVDCNVTLTTPHRHISPNQRTTNLQDLKKVPCQSGKASFIDFFLGFISDTILLSITPKTDGQLLLLRTSILTDGPDVQT